MHDTVKRALLARIKEQAEYAHHVAYHILALGELVESDPLNPKNLTKEALSGFLGGEPVLRDGWCWDWLREGDAVSSGLVRWCRWLICRL